MSANVIPDYEDVCHAANRIAGQAIKTPLLTNALLNELTGADVFLKAENFQRTGSFKFRGAYNAINAIEEDQRKKGIVACSSGNHAQGIAEAARLHEVNATIIMPRDAPEIKKARTKRSGATVIEYDRVSEDRDAIALNVCEKSGANFIHPYENPFVVAGQGTAGLEIAAAMEALGKAPDMMLVCTGGGGLTAGIALSICHHFPDCTIHSVEPAGFDDYARSLKSGTRQSNPSLSGSICDAILTQAPGELSFQINAPLLSDGKTVTDAQVRDAVKFCAHELKCIVEPGGAVCVAHLLASGKDYEGKNICLTLSGGNIDPALLAEIAG